MPKIHIDCCEQYPVYSRTEPGLGLEVEVTEADLEWIKLREKQENELQEFLKKKHEEAERLQT